jgi:hypothetical protein
MIVKTFEDAVMECFTNKQFLVEYDRLIGTNLSKRLSPIEKAIDEATKMRDVEMLGFIKFVDDFIWTLLLQIVKMLNKPTLINTALLIEEQKNEKYNRKN